MIDAILIYPRLGSMDNLIVDLPLSIMYAAAESVKRGYDVRLLDLRGESDDFRRILKPYLDQGVRLVGISVMTGEPLKNARAIARYIKRNHPGIKTIWGGPHVTVLPETIEEDFLDFAIRGYGSNSLAELIGRLRGDGPELAAIKGLSYKLDGRPVHNPRSTDHEIIPFRDIPYQLINPTAEKYTRSYLGARMFPIFSAIGCPYRCSFCVHPTVYKVINGAKWRPLPDDEVLDHIQFLVQTYGADHIAFIDDTSFPDLDRMKRIFQGVIDRGLKLDLEFRGARVNEIDRMDDEFLDLMIRAGGKVLMVGVESASDNVLRNMQKGITKEQILRIGRKLARFPQITPHYNFVYGTPGETYLDLLETKETVLELLAENPAAIFGTGGDWKPIPGSKMVALAEKRFGYQTPKTLDEWITIDTFDSKDKLYHPWYTPRHNNLIKLMQVASLVVDDKFSRQPAKTTGYRLLRLMSRIYKPIAQFRLRHNIHQLLIEYPMWRWMTGKLHLFGLTEKSPEQPTGTR